MKMAMWLDYKPTRYEGKGFLRNLNIWRHRDITGDRCGLGWGRINNYDPNWKKSNFRSPSSSEYSYRENPLIIVS